MKSKERGVGVYVRAKFLTGMCNATCCQAFELKSYAPLLPYRLLAHSKSQLLLEPFYSWKPFEDIDPTTIKLFVKSTETSTAPSPYSLSCSWSRIPTFTPQNSTK